MKGEDTGYIYALCDPEGCPRYIGKTCNPRQRMKVHLSRARNPRYRTHKDNLIRKWLRQGYTPGMTIIEEVHGTEKDLNQAEEDQIMFIGLIAGFDLTNLTYGGDGQKATEETRRKISEKAKGRILSPETRAKIAATLTGRTRTDELKQKVSAALKGRPSPLRGRTLTEADRRNKSIAQRKRFERERAEREAM